MTVWTKFKNGDRYAVAIYNYNPATVGQASLEVGELFQLLGETKHWFWGKSLRRKQEGAFPKNYVVERNCTIEQCGDVKVVTAGDGGIAHDIACTLRRWLHHWKNLYLKNDDDRFTYMEVSMRALLELRAEATSGNLPQDQLKRVVRTAVFTIDKGNRSLGMGLTVRNSNGQPVDPNTMSTYELNLKHEETNVRLEKNRESSPASGPPSAARAFCVSVRVHNLVCRGADACVWWLALHTSRADRLTEHAAPPPAHAAVAHVLFTDLNRDIKQEKVYLVCYVVRIGGMEPQNIDIRRQSLIPGPLESAGNMKRPFGIACADISRHLAANDPDKHIQLPFYACEKENFDTLLRKIILTRDIKETKHPQGLWVSLQLIEGDLQQIREEHGHLILGNTIVARKMGFPEVILPEDARNDLYVTVVGGSFSKGGKSSERNIELSARLVDKYGKVIPNAISIGAGTPLVSEYTSIVYYHEDKPRWQEVFKVCLSIEAFKEAHIVFYLRHRSSKEAKDRQELRFAGGCLRLMQRDGTTTPDITHNLCVYKIDSKHSSEAEADPLSLFLELPAHKEELPSGAERGFKKGPLSLIHRDVLTVQTRLCSTKLTQKEEILGILRWSACVGGAAGVAGVGGVAAGGAGGAADGRLAAALARLLLLAPDELVKFLQDILDALFAILTQVEDDQNMTYGILVFDCLLRVISIVSDRQFEHFQPVLLVYIDKSFCDTLAYEKLLSIMVWVITSAEETNEAALKRLVQCMKCLECLIRIIARSRQLRRELSNIDSELDFKQEFEKLLEAIIWLMRCGKYALACQGSALRYWPSALVHASKVYPLLNLSLYTVKALRELPLTSIANQRVLTLRELVLGPLCKHPASRSPLLLHAATDIASLLAAKNEEREVHKVRSVDKLARVLGADSSKLHDSTADRQIVEVCIKTIGEIMSLFSRCDPGTVESERAEVTRRLLPAVMRCCSAMINDRVQEDDPMLRRIVCALLDMVRQMSPEEYSKVAKALESEGNGVIMCQSLGLIMSLLQRPVFNEHWVAMLQLQLRIMLHALKLISTTLLERLDTSDPVELSATIGFLKEWFGACALLSAQRLSAEARRALPPAMLPVWAGLRHHKITFLPSAVGPFLEVSFLKDEEVREMTIPVLFDMMQTQYDHSLMCKENVDNPLKNLENELIDKLDVIVERGCGDVHWRSTFVTVCGGLANSAAPEFRAAAAALVAAAARQLDALLDYRAATGKLHRMHLTTGVLNFYSEITRPTQYIRYVHKLAEMHRSLGQWAEAGLCLRLHARLLAWSDDALPPGLALPDSPHAPHSPHSPHSPHTPHTPHTHMALKEYLYSEAAEFLNQGHQWELAVEIVKELVSVYEDKLAGYAIMADLHTKLASLYNAMLRIPRSHPQYFRVLYHGQGFPKHLRNQYGFVYRGKEYEQLQEFTERMLDEWPRAELLTSLDPPPPHVTDSDQQYLQINSVVPEMGEKYKRFSGKSAASQILKYYRWNNVNKFVFNRPYNKNDETVNGSVEDIAEKNEFARRWLERTELETYDTLPDIVGWSAIRSARTVQLSPLQAAIEELANKNESLQQVVRDSRDPTSPLHPLTMRLVGILDAAVMGGIDNYEKAFFTPSYLERHPEHSHLTARLLDLIVEMIPILKCGLELHKSRIPASVEKLHNHLQSCFDKMEKDINQRYGRKAEYFEPETPEVQLRISVRDTPASPGFKNQHRNSDVSSNEGSTLKSKCIGFGSRNSGGMLFGTLQNSPKRREKRRRDRKSEICSSQWYTSSTPNGSAASSLNMSGYQNFSSNNNVWPEAGNSLFELTQELVTERRPRAEVEKERRLSQRTSLINTSAPTSNRNSIGTTDSNQEEEEPPPLPQKCSQRHSDHDHNNNPDAATSLSLTPRYSYDTVLSPRGSFLYNSMAIRKSNNSEKAPTPPPKMKHKHNKT